MQEPKTQTQAMTKSPVVSSQVQVKSKDEAPVIKNNLAEPEYDFLSKQPTEIVDETYKVDKFEKRNFQKSLELLLLLYLRALRIKANSSISLSF